MIVDSMGKIEPVILEATRRRSVKIKSTPGGQTEKDGGVTASLLELYKVGSWRII